MVSLTALRRLEILRFSQLAIPSGVANPMIAGFQPIVDPATRTRLAREAQAWVTDALAVVRTAPDADPLWSDEEIAAHILAKIDEKKGATP